MTTPITKERLIKIKEWRELYGAGSNVVLPAEEAEELARIALAEMEAEKIILYRERNPYNGMTTGWQELTDDEYEFIKDKAGENAEFRTVFTAPPALVDNTFIPKNLDRALGVVGVALPESKEEFNFQIERWIQRLIDRVIRYADEFKEQPEPVVPKATPSLKAMMQALDAFYAEEEVPERGMLSAFRILLDDTCRTDVQSNGNPEQLEPVSQPYKLPPNSFTDDELEMMSHGNNPQANAYRELLAFRRNYTVIPDGWVMVSIDPTEKMLIAGLEEANPLGGLIDWDASRGDCNTREQVRDIFKAMLAAAPQQEVQSQVQEQRASIREEMAMGSRLTNQRFRVK